MKPPSASLHSRVRFARLSVLALGASLLGAPLPAQTAAPAPAQGAATFNNCPMIGWPELLPGMQKPGAPFPTSDTKELDAPDCAFHQWSWEAFVWATTLEADGVPRFMKLPTEADLLDNSSNAGLVHTRKLKLGLRSLAAHGADGFSEDAGAIVEADSNMLVARNGYPVYASVHMNPSYFSTAKHNLIIDGGYEKQITEPTDDHFNVGAAVFKATWLRLDPGDTPPDGAYVTDAEVPVLTVYRTKNSMTVAATKQTVTVKVALVGLHVVGYTENHPEFLWGTFEHRDNTPTFADNSFNDTSTQSDPKTYTFYQGGTPYTQVNCQDGNQSKPYLLKFDLATQRFTTVTVPDRNAASGTAPSNSRGTNAVLANRTGSETFSPNGPANIEALNKSAHTFFASEAAPQSTFGNYNLVGTVWMNPGVYDANFPTTNQANAVGSVNLANTTAETFFQRPMLIPSNSTGPDVQNCFLCHNPTSYNFQNSPPKLPPRKIALSHVLSVGTPYAVANLMPVLVPTSQGAPATEAKPVLLNPSPKRH